MVDLHNPTTVKDEYLAYMKFCHVLSGLYIWEFFTTLDYEWSVIQGRRPYRPTIWIYSFMRLATLIAVILILVGLNTTKPIDCQPWVIFTFIFSCMSLSAGLLLIVLRIIAIWDKNKIVIAVSTVLWVGYLTSMMQAISVLRSSWTWSAVLNTSGCSLPDMERNKIAFAVLFGSDLTLVSIMFLGLLRLRSRNGGMFGIVTTLWKQGFIWVMIVAGTGLLSVVFIFLNLSPIYNMMFLLPVQISIPITATRIYTSLTDFSSAADIMVDSDLERGRHAFSNSNARPTPVVHVHMAREEFSTVTTPSPTSSHNSRGQPCDRLQRLSLGNSPKCGMGK